MQESVLDQISSHLSAIALQRDPARRVAIAANTSVALLVALAAAADEGPVIAANIRTPSVEKAFLEIIHVRRIILWYKRTYLTVFRY